MVTFKTFIMNSYSMQKEEEEEDFVVFDSVVVYET